MCPILFFYRHYMGKEERGGGGGDIFGMKKEGGMEGGMDGGMEGLETEEGGDVQCRQ